MKLNSLIKSGLRPFRSAGSAIAAAIALSLSADAAVVLAVDFGGNSGNLQSGFQGFTNPPDAAISATQSYSGISVTLSGGVQTNGTTGYLNARDRPHAPPDAGAFTNFSLLRDRIVANGGSNAALHGVLLTIGGLMANTDYTIQVWGFDTRAAVDGGGAKAGTNVLWDNSNGSDYELGRYTMTAGQLPVDNNSFSITATVTTDASGVLMVRSFNPGSDRIDGPGIMNGFVLSIVPEPSSSLLILSGAGLFLVKRRRTH